MINNTLIKPSKQLVFPNQINEVKLTYKKAKLGFELPKIKSSNCAFKILYDNWDKETIEYYEAFKVLLLDRNNRVLGIYKISEGGTAGCIVDIKKIYQAALVTSSSSIIVAHNHPSGNPQPSEQDKSITQRIKQAGENLSLPLLDHLLILPNGNYTSFSDEGLM